MSGDAVRAFVAMELDEAMREQLATEVERLRSRLQGVSWVRPGAIHLTLRFLGPARGAALDEMIPRLRAAASRCSPPSTPVAGLGVFPERGRARVLWIGIAVPPAVLALQAECESAAVAAGFGPEPRPFRPHLTLGRWREGAPRPELPTSDLGPAALRQLVLYSSELRPDGARYSPLERFPLGESG